MKKEYSKPKVDTYIENFFKLNRGLFKRFRSYFIYQFIKKHFKSRSKVLVKNLQCKPLSKSQKKEIKDYYAGFGFKNINTEWHRFFTHVSGKFYKEYIPVGFFLNVVTPHLNMSNVSQVLTDKNLLDKLFQNIGQPETIIKNINGYFIQGDCKNILTLDHVVERCKKYSKLIIKPSIDSGGGKNITVFNIKGNKTDFKNLSIDEIIRSYNKNFIIQNYFIQHRQMSKLNPSSVNTLRIQSILINNKVEIIVSYVRIGGKGSYIDNSVGGGIFCNLDKDGYLSEYGFKGNGQSFLETETKVKLGGFKIPNYVNILSEIKKLHLQVPYFRIVAWDVAINENAEPILLEFNLTAQGTDHQGVTGPLFGKYTDRILSECKVKMFS